MRLILVRHGESVGNSQRLIQGRTPGELTERGFKQASLLAKRLTSENISHVYVSPQNRCIQTLNEISKLITIPHITVDNRIKERAYGDFEGISRSVVDLKSLDDDTIINHNMGVETIAEMEIRASEFLNSLNIDARTKDTVLVVSHGQILRVLLSILLRRTYHEILETFQMNNTCLFILDIKGTDVTPVLLDSTKHLEV